MVVYADTSVFVASALREPQRDAARKRLKSAARVVTSALTEAELASALARSERSPEADAWLAGVYLLMPPRPLRREIRRVLRIGYAKGADCWHLANALWFRDSHRIDLAFVTLDERQRRLADALGLEP
ncbi:MAG: PIN domain-containing protein [Gemmatimonadaceae bacterium]|nr:PIN domain-containing protein [Gemmatimonadaceae bacterium]